MKPLGINDVESYVGIDSMGQTRTKDSQLAKYKLPITDVDRARRNFEGYEKNQWYSLGEIQEGDFGGTTETDSKTAPESGGYSTINQKSGKDGRPWKSSSKKGN